MMRSKWHRNIVAVTLVAVFAAGTVAVSGGYEEFRFGIIGGDPLRGMAITSTHDMDAAWPAVVTGYTVGAFVAGFFAAAGAWAWQRIAPWRNPSDRITVGSLGEAIFDF